LEKGFENKLAVGTECGQEIVALGWVDKVFQQSSGSHALGGARVQAHLSFCFVRSRGTHFVSAKMANEHSKKIDHRGEKENEKV
jgi:hypothetical protein